MDTILEYFGRLHPIFLHFPITLLWVAGTIEILRCRKDSLFLSRCTIWLMALGALSAIAASGSGWWLAAHEHIRQDQQSALTWHRWLGIVTAAMAVVGWLSSIRWRETASPRQAWARHLIIWVSTGLLTAAAHYGATLVWGSDWLT